MVFSMSLLTFFIPLTAKSFRELNASPEKAKKPHNRPRDGREFAEKYLNGYYDLLNDRRADKK